MKKYNLRVDLDKFRLMFISLAYINERRLHDLGHRF